MYLSYVGIRVKDLDRSLKFYAGFFGLREVSRGDNRSGGGGVYVLLRDDFSGQKLELNWYLEGSPYATPYAPGEGLDHVAFRVASVPEALERLAREGIRPVEIPSGLREPDPGVRVAYVKDPDGNWIELYHHPDPIGPEVPAGY